MYGIPFITQPEILENYQIHHIGLLCFSQYHDLLAHQVTHNRYLTKACPDAGSRGLVNSAATPHTITATFGLGGRNRARHCFPDASATGVVSSSFVLLSPG